MNEEIENHILSLEVLEAQGVDIDWKAVCRRILNKLNEQAVPPKKPDKKEASGTI